VFFKKKPINKFLKLDKFYFKHDSMLLSYSNFFFKINSFYFFKKTVTIYQRVKSLRSFLFTFYYKYLFTWVKLVNELNNPLDYTLNLNFKRNRFFPQFKDTIFKKTIFNNSLGTISKYFSRRKSYLRGKSSYLLSAAYIRRILTSLGVNYLYLEITKIPKYLKDIIRVVTANTNVLYKNPFNPKDIVNEKVNPVELKFKYVFFFNNKPYSVVKIKKKGRLKRKISKKITLLNNILD